MVSMRGALQSSVVLRLTFLVSLERGRDGGGEESDEGQECELHLGWACWNVGRRRTDYKL